MILPTHEEHQDLGATFMELNGAEAVAHYGDVHGEFGFLQQSAGVLDFSFRTRIALIGEDRIQFLHSQCTNDIKRLNPGEGCYTAITNNKGRMEGDANVLVLEDEALIDMEPGQAEVMTERFGHFIVSEDVEVVDAGPHYGLLTVQGPRSGDVIRALELDMELPDQQFQSVKCDVPVLGELYVANNPRLGSCGFDIFAPVEALGVLLDKLTTAAKNSGGGLVGWEAFDMARVKAGIPRFGVDMTERHLAPEAGIESRAISYQKGCYIGQEILNRLRTFAEVRRRLCRFQLSGGPGVAATVGSKLFRDGKEIGFLTSVASVPDSNPLALGYAGKEWLDPGQRFELESGDPVEQLGTLG